MVEPTRLDDDVAKQADDSSQDPAQPQVGPAIQFKKLVVPDDEPVTDDNPYGEIIDQK